MSRGHTLPELALTIALVGVVMASVLPQLRGWLDWIAVQQTASEVTSALAVTRSAAIARAARTRLTIRPDSLRLDEWGDTTWVARARWPGPDQHRVTMAVSNPIVTFDPIGLGWGLADTKVVLSRGLRNATITTSRLGRVKRW
jgi:Tfp pilus assembly protein FimT